jgi:hypothetical protein
MTSITNRAKKVKTEDEAIEFLSDFTSNKLSSLKAYSDLPLEFKNNLEVNKYFLIHNPNLYFCLSKELKENRETTLELVSVEESLLKEIDASYVNDGSFIEEAVAKNGNALRILREYFPSKEYHSNKELILRAVKNKGYLLEYASTELKNTYQVVKEAVLSKTEAYLYVGDNFVQNPEKIVFIDPLNFLVMSSSYKDDNTFEKMRKNLKDHNYPETAQKFENIFLKKGQWKEFIELLDASCMSTSKSLTLIKVADEIFYYFSFMMPHWKDKSIKTLKNETQEYLSDKNNHVENKEILTFLNDLFEKEQSERIFKNNVKKVVLEKDKSEAQKKQNKSRKISI